MQSMHMYDPSTPVCNIVTFYRSIGVKVCQCLCFRGTAIAIVAVHD
jgi:hypothetical protein